MLTEPELARVSYEIDTLGFSVIKEVVDSAEVARLRAALIAATEADHAQWQGRPGKRYDLVNNLVVHGGPFLDLLDNAVMQQVFGHFLTQSAILYNYGSTFLLPGSEAATLRTHVDAPRVIPGYHPGLIMTLALDDFTAENGATLYLPGSQQLERIPEEATFAHYSLSVARPAGAAVFFNPRCFHRATPNRSSRIRCGLTVFAVRAFMKQRFDFPRMVGAETVARLSPKARQFLGFDARVPAAMEEYYVGEAERLYKANQG